MKHYYVVAMISFFSLHCTNNLTPLIDNITPGDRNYSWSVDTLALPAEDFVVLIGMWGSSDQDVWLVGYGDISTSTVWHSDGTSWSRYGSRLSASHHSLFGIASNDVWMVDAPNGENIWRYNGSAWGNMKLSTRAGVTTLALQDIWGDTSTNLFAVGYEDTEGASSRMAVLQYNGKIWSYCDIPTINDLTPYAIRRDGRTGKYYIGGTINGSSQGLSKIYEFDGNRQLSEVYSGSDGTGLVCEINGNVYLSGGKTVSKIVNGAITPVLDFSSTKLTFGRMWGRSEKDLFLIAWTDSLYGVIHFNGTDWQFVYQLQYQVLTQYFVTSVMLFEKSVFICVTDLKKTWVVHGKLNS